MAALHLDGPDAGQAAQRARQRRQRHVAGRAHGDETDPRDLCTVAAGAGERHDAGRRARGRGRPVVRLVEHDEQAAGPLGGRRLPRRDRDGERQREQGEAEAKR